MDGPKRRFTLDGVDSSVALTDLRLLAYALSHHENDCRICPCSGLNGRPAHPCYQPSHPCYLNNRGGRPQAIEQERRNIIQNPTRPLLSRDVFILRNRGKRRHHGQGRLQLQPGVLGLVGKPRKPRDRRLSSDKRPGALVQVERIDAADTVWSSAPAHHRLGEWPLAKETGWGGRIRTCEWRHQKPLPYRLATPQRECAALRPRMPHEKRQSAGRPQFSRDA